MHCYEPMVYLSKMKGTRARWCSYDEDGDGGGDGDTGRDVGICMTM